MEFGEHFVQFLSKKTTLKKHVFIMDGKSAEHWLRELSRTFAVVFAGAMNCCHHRTDFLCRFAE